MHLFRISVIGLLELSLTACSTKQTKFNNQVIEQTLDSAIIFFTYDHLDSSILGHYDFFPDTLRHISSKILQNAAVLDSISNIERAMSSDLSQGILDSVNFKFREPYRFKRNVIYEVNPSVSLRDSAAFFGSINLSDPVYSKDKSQSCYYFALNCYQVRKGGCTFSAAVFAKLIDDKWEITAFRLLFDY